MTDIALQHTNEKKEYQSWAELLKEGDGYLNPKQREQFERAVYMVLDQIKTTFDKTSPDKIDNKVFDFQNSIEKMEDRFLNVSSKSSELEKEASLTAYRVVEKVADRIIGAS